MRILFVFGALTHYFNYVLNRLNKTDGIQLSALIAFNGSATVGKGVNQSKEGINFNLIELEEYTTWYKKPFFKGFKQMLIDQKIDIIVLGWPYILGFVFQPSLLKFCKKNNIKIIFREIPFQVPKKEEAYKYYSTVREYAENNDAPLPSGGLKTYLKAKILTSIRSAYYRKADAFLTYAETGLEILPTYGVDKNKITVFYNSPDTEELKNTYEKVISENPILTSNPHRIIHVGRLVKWKSVDVLIEAVALLKDEIKDIELLILGGGPETESLQKLSVKLNCENNVKFVGAVYDATILGHYFYESTVYVLAGMGGLSINEAMAFGKPVIVSVADGTEKHLVKDDFNGYYFEEGNAKDLAQKIRLLISDTEKVKLFGERSLSIIRNDINSDKVINAFVKSFNLVKK